MKKTLTFLLILASSSLFAQVNWSIKSLKSPTELQTTNANVGTPISAVIECENLGTDTARAGDSIIYNLLVISPDLPASQNILYRFPSTATYALDLLREDVPPNGTYDITINQTILVYTRNSINVVVGATSYLFDRTANLIDSDSTNNLLGENIIWYNEYRNGVSVNEVDYNNKVTAYPNPANDILNVDLLYTKVADIKIELVDITGKTVISENSPNLSQLGAFKLNTAGVENGVYILKVSNGTEVSTRKVTIAH